MKQVTLYGLTTKGKIKVWKIKTVGGTIVVNHGLLDGKIQESLKVCKAVNEGKANERDAAEQAETEALAQIKEQKESGYSEEMPIAGGAVKNAALDFENIPKPFCPSKPFSGSCPKKVEDDPNAYAQRKFNGNCLILKKAKAGNIVYSRMMIDQTFAISVLPPIAKRLKEMKVGQMLNNEFRFFYKDGRESTEALGLLKVKSPEEALKRYEEFSKIGTFELVTFDILFNDGKFVGDLEYFNPKKPDDQNTRYGIISKQFSTVPVVIQSPDWKKYVKYRGDIPTPAGLALTERWEGFVIRVYGDSAVTYTLNGKADRAGAYKFKFMNEDDFIVTEVAKGDSGEHQDLYCRFHLGQYNKKGEVVDCGWAGPGTLKREQLRDYTEDIESGDLRFPFVVEVEFRAWTEKNNVLEHPVIQRLRFDKRPSECLFNE